MNHKNLTIHTELLDGSLDGIRNIYMGANSTCHLYVIPRNLCGQVSTLPEVVEQPAFYILLGDDVQDGPSAYIGQTTDFATRKSEHLKNKAWWKVALVFISDNHKIYGDDVRFLEYLGIKRAQEVDPDKLYNEANPKRPNIAPYRVNDMDVFFRDIVFLTEFYGCRIFTPAAEAPQPTTQPTSPLFLLSIPDRTQKEKGLTEGLAKGYFNPDTKEFTLLKGSVIASCPAPSYKNSGSYKQWQEWIALNCQTTKGKTILTADFTFPTPSAASVTALGAHSNGWTAWKDTDGHTLDSLYRHP